MKRKAARRKNAHSLENFEQYGISPEDLKELMKQKRDDFSEALKQLGGAEGLCELLQTSTTNGISNMADDVQLQQELKRRKTIFGTNSLPTMSQTTFLQLIWDALKDATLIILEVAALISLVLSIVTMSGSTGDSDEGPSWIEGLSIMVSVFVVVIVTAFNNYTKERQFRALQKRIDLERKHDVIRNGLVQQIVVGDIVVGDICRIKYGDLLPADGVVVSSNDLKVDESTLTGESDFVKKHEAEDALLLSGTTVMEGSGKMLVTAVGVNSQAGIIYMLLNEKKTPQKGRKKTKKRKREKKSKSKRVSEVESNEAVGDGKSNKSVLQVKLFKMAMRIGYVGLAFASMTVIILIIIFCVYTFHVLESPWQSSHAQVILGYFIIGVTILVVAVPEGLPLAVTLSLAYSVRKMMRDNNLVRHIDSCETMGNATTICCDKTGTLTLNRMTVVEIYMCETRLENPSRQELDDVAPQVVSSLIFQVIAVNSNYSSKIAEGGNGSQGRAQMVGNATECAMLEFITRMQRDYNEIRSEHPEEAFVKVYTFNSIRKSMSTVIRNVSGGYRLLTKGASEIILQKCTRFHGASGVLKTLTPEIYAEWLREIIVPMASNGLRTIGLAYRDFKGTGAEPNWNSEEAIVRDLTFLALFGIEDPVREEVPAAIQSCVRAGITVRMVTGDNVNTARAIAQKCGILAQAPKTTADDDDGVVMEGEEFNRRIRDADGVMHQDLVDKVWPNLLVLARSSPEDKYNLVNGIIESKISINREVVAVTGDGTNDGPALKKADVGFAMGVTGTDVAKEAADIIITDDNFNSIVRAVMWGRNIYDNICKFLQFQLTANVVACLVCVVSACGAGNTPLKTVQILWINMVMDTLASLALATELPTEDLLKRRPYGRTRSLISGRMLKNILGQSVYQITVLLCLVFVGAPLLNIPSGIGINKSAPTQHYTIVFNTFVMMILFNEVNSRKLHGERNVFKGLFRNPVFYGIWIGSFVVQVIIVEFGYWVFSTAKLDPLQWGVCLALGASTLLWQQVLISFNCWLKKTV